MSEKPQGGLFFSLLDPQETNVRIEQRETFESLHKSHADKEWDRRAASQAFDVQPATATETAFRHRGWPGGREAVKIALRAAEVPAARSERFNACGANCVIEWSPSSSRHRVRASYCHDRFCRPCCEAKAKKLAVSLEAWTAAAPARFLTLTLREDGKPLRDRLNRLYRSFRALRATALWRAAVDGGAAVVEITRGTTKKGWHVHLHAVICGRFIDQKSLSDAWRRITKDSFVVHIRAISNAGADARYVAKYAAKGWSDSVLEDPDALLECVVSLRGRRLLLTFGEWHGRDEVERHDQPEDWQRVGRLDFIFARAIAGEEWARGVFRSLNTAVGVSAGDAVFFGLEPDWGPST